MEDPEKDEKGKIKKYKPRYISQNQPYIDKESTLDKKDEWDKLILQINSENSEIRKKSAKSLSSIFPLVKNKKKAWKDLIKLTENHDQEVKLAVSTLIGYFFKDVPNKKIVYNDLYRLTRSNDWSIKLGLAKSFGFSFQHFQDKRKAWNELIQFTKDENEDIKVFAIKSIGAAFLYSPDKGQAWNFLFNLVIDDNNPRIKLIATESLVHAIKYVPNKEKAWEDLLLLTKNDSQELRVFVTKSLGTSFKYIPFKKDARENLITLTRDLDKCVKLEAIKSLEFSFRHMPSNKTWNYLIKLTKSKDSDVKMVAIDCLGSIFQYMPDKRKAWNDLVRLVKLRKSKKIKLSIAKILFNSFPYVFNKVKAWGDFHVLEKQEGDYLKIIGDQSLASYFSYVHNETEAWNCMNKLLSDKNSDVRRFAVYVVGSTFQDMPKKEKEEIWSKLIVLADDENEDVRSGVTLSLRYSFLHFPDKDKAWTDLILLTKSKYPDVRRGVAYKLSRVYQHVPNKKKAWDDLIELTEVEDDNLKTSIYYTLGKASILKATESKTTDSFREILKEAIDFFEKASIGSPSFFNPSKFCLPFYRLFYITIFMEKNNKNDIEIHFIEAKKASHESKDKEIFLDILQNIANALEEVQGIKGKNLPDIKSSLRDYKTYCDKVLKLTKTNKKDSTINELIEISIRIANEKLSAIFEEIRNDIIKLYEESKGTQMEEVMYNVSKEIQKISRDSINFNEQKIKMIVSNFRTKIPNLPENKLVLDKIEDISNKKIQDEEHLLEELTHLVELTITMKTGDGNIDINRRKPTIGIITALPKEYVAVNVLLENKQENYKIPGPGAGRRYCLGEIIATGGNKHSLVLVTAGMGNNIAATKASLLLEHFPNVKSIIMVGIAGGVPNPEKGDDHVRLGDIVVSNEYGVIQYDNIKKETRKIIFRNPPRPPSASLLEEVKYLEAGEILGNRPWEKHINQALSIIKTIRPSEDKDVLYCSDSQGEIIKHPEDPKRIEGKPRVFTGPIASANILQKDPKARDKLREKFGVKAIEMEASGIADATWNHEVGYLVVRGICDYCDSHKNDEWQQYAAVVAAAYTRALIESMP